MGLHLASIQLHNLPHLYLLGGGILTGLLYTGPLASYFDWCTRLLHGSAGWLDNTRFIKKKTPSSGLIRPFKKTTEAASRMDSLLEKIHAKGMAALTDEERRLLDEYSRSSNETNP